jgi:hypothetical protein
MVFFNGPRLRRHGIPFRLPHVQFVRRPILRATVSGNGPKDLDEAEALEMHAPPGCWNDHRRQRHIPVSIRVDQPIVLESRQEHPPMLAHGFHILPAALPTIEADQRRREPTLFGCGEQRSEMLVLGTATRQGFSIDATIARHTGGTIGPDQRAQVDALDDLVVFPAPMVCDQVDLMGIRRIQGGIIQDQHAAHGLHIGCDFLPQGCRVGWLAMEQAHKGIVRWWKHCLRGTLGRFRAGVHALRGNQDVNVINIDHFWCVHRVPMSAKVACLSTA